MVKCKIVTALVALTLISGMGGKMEKFDWLASESAPKNYPMEIVSGDFFYHDGGSLYVPNRKTIHKGWGTPVSNHVVGPEFKSLPNRLDITFFSYSENVFYQGSFDLAYERIRNLFGAGYYSPKERGQTTYDEITAGVAPGGVVSVWLYGLDRRTEVFFGHAEKVEIPWERILDNPEVSREEFISDEIKESLDPEAYESFKQDGIPYGTWDRYHTRYHWQLDVVVIGKPVIIERMEFYNGEIDYRLFPLDESVEAQTKAIPSYIGFIWQSPEGQAYTIRYSLDEAEIFAAFDQLAPGEGEVIETPLRLEIRIEDRDDGKRHTDLWLHGQQKSLLLEATQIKSAKTERWSDLY